MKKYIVSLLVLFLIVMLAGACSDAPSDDAIQTAIAKTSDAVTPTNTDMPTNTSMPTNTTEPTATPMPTRTPVPTNTAQNQPGSRSNPFSFGEPGTFVKDGDKEVTVAVVEVLRGQDAYDRVMRANSYNDDPPEGFEYVLVKLSVNYVQGPSPDDMLEISYNVWGNDYEMGCVSNNQIVTEETWVSGLDPEFDFKLFPGAQAEGYLALFCESGDENSHLFFGVDDGSYQYFSLK